MAFSQRFGQVDASVKERACGGWIAVSAPGAFLRIGVFGNTATEAVAKFEAAVATWSALWDEQGKTQESR